MTEGAGIDIHRINDLLADLVDAASDDVDSVDDPRLDVIHDLCHKLDAARRELFGPSKYTGWT